MKSAVVTVLSCICALTLLSSISMADDKLDSLKSIYDREKVKIEAQHKSDLNNIKKIYLAHLDADLKKATNKGNLDDYSQIEIEKKRFYLENSIPENSSVQRLLDEAEAKKNASIVRLSKKYVAVLNAHKIALMKAKNIEGAKTVQSEIKKIESASVVVEPNNHEKLPPVLGKQPLPKTIKPAVPARNAIVAGTSDNLPSQSLVTFLESGSEVEFKKGVKLFSDQSKTLEGAIPPELDGQTLLVTSSSSTKVKFNKSCKVWALCQSRKKDVILNQARDMEFKASNFPFCSLYRGSYGGWGEGTVTVMEKNVQAGETLIFGDWVRLVVETKPSNR